MKFSETRLIFYFCLCLCFITVQADQYFSDLRQQRSLGLKDNDETSINNDKSEEPIAPVSTPNIHNPNRRVI